MKLVPNGVSRAIARQALVTEKNAPTLLFASGIAGMTASTVLACRATLKMHQVIETTQHDLDTAHSLDHPNYSESDRKKDVAVIYTRGVFNTAKLYAPAVLLGAASVGCLTKSHSMLNERNVALTAAYAAVDTAFEKYRERVINKYGEEQDREFRYPSEEIEVVDENGKVDLKRVALPDPDGSMYARWFDGVGSADWTPDQEYNYTFLTCQQNFFNDRLRARGHVFLNEVYDRLGLERTKAGQAVGWLRDGDGDGYVDFGFNPNSHTAQDWTERWWISGREGAILLDFNVDGVIWDKIDKGDQ